MVERFQPTAYRLAVALLSDEHQAEDALQEAFFEAVRRVDALREPRAYPGWLRQIVRTQANRIRRRRTEQPRELPADSSSPEPSPARRIEAAELRRRVRGALGELSPAGRETAELFYLELYSVSEVAAALNVPEGTVKRRLHDARNRLRGLLIGLPAGPEPLWIDEDSAGTVKANE